MTTNSDFNLVAQINLQLAKGAAEKLAKDVSKQLDKEFSVKAKVKPEIIRSGELNKIFPKDGKTPIVIPVSLNVKNEKAFNDLMAAKSVSIDVKIPAASIKSIDKLNTSMGNLIKTLGGLSKLQATFGAIKSAATATAGATIKLPVGKGAAPKSKGGVALQNLQARLSDLATKGSSGDFIPAISTQINKLIKDYKNLDQAAARFDGVNGKSTKNVINALEQVQYAIREIEITRSRLDRKGLLAVDPNLAKSLDEAKAKAIAMLNSIDAVSQIPLESGLQAALRPMNDLVRSAENYRSLIRATNLEINKATKSNAGQSVIDNLRKRLTLIQSARASGTSIDNLKDSSDYQNTIGQNGNLTSIDKAARSASRNINKYRKSVAGDSIYSSAGADAINASKSINKLLDDAREFVNLQRQSGSPGAATQIEQYYDNLKANIGRVTSTAKELNIVLDNLGKKKAFYDANGLTQAGDAVEAFKNQVISLAQSGQPLNQNSSLFTQTIYGIEALGQGEAKIKRFTSAVDRLRASLQFGLAGGQDFAGLTDYLDTLEAKIKSYAGKGVIDDKEVRNTLSEGSYKARAKEKLNRTVNGNIDSFDQAIFERGGKDFGPARGAFVQAKAQYESFVKGLKLSSNEFVDINKNIGEVSRNFDALFARASIQAEGGFVGAIAKSVGLAAKRLGSFLFAARAVYGVQNALISATESAVELDTEFTKLEQIFAGSNTIIGSVDKNVQSLASNILTLGKNFGVSTTEISKSADILAQAGIQGKDLEKVLTASTQAKLGPTFTDSTQITEAAIAAMNQFNLKANDVKDVLGGIAQVSAQYAVESDGITKAIRRAGGAFAAAKADGQSYLSALGDFVGAFTVLKEQTREADETLATSLRNVLNRLQRGSVQKFLKDKYSIDLLDQNNQFKGFAAAIQEVSSKIKELNIKSGDPRFAELVQKLAGSLQSSRLTSLLQDADRIQGAVANFNQGAGVLDRDANIAFGSIENKLTRATNAVVELFTQLSRSDAVKALIELFTTLTNLLTSTVQALGEVTASFGFLGGAMAAISGVKLFAGPVSNFLKTAKNGFLRGAGEPAIVGGGILPGLATGGMVPGNGPNVDTEPYMLAKGEYVVNKFSVMKYGKGFFDGLNSGKIKHAATGSGPGGMITPLSGGVNKLDDYLRSFGIVIKNLGAVVKDFTVEQKLTNRAGNATKGTYSSRTGGIRVDAARGFNFETISHELTHALDTQLNLSNKVKIPKEIREATLTRLKDRSDIYGENPSKNVVRREMLADFGARAFSYKAGDKSNSQHERSFKDFFKILESKGHGVSGNYKFYDPSAALGGVDTRSAGLTTTSGIISQIRNAGPARRGGGGGFIPPVTGLGSPAPGGGGGGAAAVVAAMSGGASKLTTMFNAFGGWTTAITAGTYLLASYGSSTKDANDKLQVLVKAVAAASAAMITYTFITQAASKATASEGVTRLIRKIGVTRIPGLGGARVAQLGSAIGESRLARTIGVTRVPFLGGTRVAQLGARGISGAAGIAGGIVFAASKALQVFAQSSIDASNKIIDASTSEAEVREQLASIGKKEAGKRTAGSLGIIAAGAGLGATVGTAFGGPVGTGVGAVVGGLLAGLSQVTSLMPNFSNALSSAIGYISEWGAAVGNVLLGGIESLGSGLDSLAGAVFGVDEKKIAGDNSFRENLALSGANLNFFNKGAKRRGGILRSDKDALVRGAGQLQSLTTGFSELDEEKRQTVKDQGQRLKDALDLATPLQQAGILDQAKKSGVDIVSIFKTLGVEFNEVGAASAQALDKMSMVFLRMETVAKDLNDKVDTANANTELFSNKAAQIAGEGRNNSIPSSIFEVLRSGGNVSGPSRQALDQQLSAFNRFSPEAANNAALEHFAARGARGLSGQLAAGNIKAGGDGGFPELVNSLTKSFQASTAGASPEIRSKLDDMFSDYLDANEQALTSATGGGSPDAGKIAESVNGFANSVKKGSLDLFQKFSESNNQFSQALDGVIKRRIGYEDKITDLLRANVDKQKSLIEFRNKAAGKADTDISLNQARGIDAQKQALLLRGTGLGGNASVGDIRSKYSQLSGMQSTPVIEALKDNLVKALEGIASGTDGFTTAMREFDKASEKAKRRTEEFSNALLGTDENLINMIKGIHLENNINMSKNSGEAFLHLRNADEESRAALQARLAADPDAQLAINRKLGVSTDIQASPQARLVEGEFANQASANQALASINQDLSNRMGGLADEMIRNRGSFETLGLQINNFAGSANNLAASLSNIPQNITHQHTFTFSPLQVSFTGADSLANLNAPTQAAVMAVVNSELNKFANSLRAKNKGLTIDTIALNSARA